MAGREQMTQNQRALVCVSSQRVQSRQTRSWAEGEDGARRVDGIVDGESHLVRDIGTFCWMSSSGMVSASSWLQLLWYDGKAPFTNPSRHAS
jgi:hypothetical protein